MTCSPTSPAGSDGIAAPPTPTEVVTSEPGGEASVPTIDMDAHASKEEVADEVPTIIPPEVMRHEKAQTLDTEIPIPPMPDLDASPIPPMPGVDGLPTPMLGVDGLPTPMPEVDALPSAASALDTGSTGISAPKLQATPKPVTASMKRKREQDGEDESILGPAPATILRPTLASSSSRPHPRPSVSASVAAAAATGAPAVPFPMASGARPHMPGVAVPRPSVAVPRPSAALAAATAPPPPRPVAPKRPARVVDPATRRPKLVPTNEFEWRIRLQRDRKNRRELERRQRRAAEYGWRWWRF